MPYVHTWNFRVRHYECDFYGRVHPANYLRYMQESAFDASAAVGYNTTRYREIGYHWLAYETDLEYLHPLHYGDSVHIKTWVVDFRRVRSLRNYEFYRENQLVAFGSTDWVLIDTNAMYPATIPPEIIAAYSQGEPVEPAPPRDPLPASPAPPPDVFTLRRRVTWKEIDPAGHVNNAVYLNYVADCEMQVLGAYNWPVSRLHSTVHDIVTQRHQIEYKTAIVLDDEIEIASWLSDVGETSAVRHYTINRVTDGKLVARVRALWSMVDLTTRQPARFPPQFLEDLRGNIA